MNYWKYVFIFDNGHLKLNKNYSSYAKNSDELLDELNKNYGKFNRVFFDQLTSAQINNAPRLFTRTWFNNNLDYNEHDGDFIL